MIISEAELLGIDISKLEQERPSHPIQQRIHRDHAAKAKIYWQWKKFETLKPQDRFDYKKEYKFSKAQLALIEEIIERKKANGR